MNREVYLVYYPEQNRRGFSGWKIMMQYATPFRLPSQEKLNEAFHESCPHEKMKIEIVNDPASLLTEHIIRLPGKLRPNQREYFRSCLAAQIAT